jgi:hypothetical protein
MLQAARSTSREWGTKRGAVHSIIILLARLKLWLSVLFPTKKSRRVRFHVNQDVFYPIYILAQGQADGCGDVVGGAHG